MRLSEKLEAWVAHAELVASGLAPMRKRALAALAEGRPGQARQLASEMLDAVPRSPLALAVWADAAEAMLLDHEVCEALERLAEVVPYRADVWLRLAELKAKRGEDVDELLERVEVLSEPREAVQQAVTKLLESALDLGNVARCISLAGRLKTSAHQSAVQRARLAEAALASGYLDEARRWLSAASPPELTDARGWLTLARIQQEAGGAQAQQALKRAMLTGNAAVRRKVADHLIEKAAIPSLQAMLPLAVELGVGEFGEWQVVRAMAYEQASDALKALELQALKAPSTASRSRFLHAVLRAQDPAALERALELLRNTPDSRRARASYAEAEKLRAALQSVGTLRLSELDPVQAEGRHWARVLRRDVYKSWLTDAGSDGVASLMGELELLAKQWLQVDVLNRVASLRLDLERPLRVAVIGEFNAGKSSLINCIVGAPVAPVGVLPTTATVNRLRWAPDRFVQIEFKSAERPRRVLDYAGLKDFLASVDAREVAHVTIFGPLEALRSLEVIDTPGFNADRPEHDERALDAIRSAHVLLWVLDATGPLRATDANTVQRLRQVLLPIVVVVNKADRIDPDELEEVMQHVSTGLESLGIELEAPACALSAARVQGVSTGDTKPPNASGWSDFQQLLDSLLARASELKARALKERVRSLVKELQQRHPQADLVGFQPGESVTQAAHRLAARRVALEAEWAQSLGEPLKQLRNELEPLPRDQPEAAKYAATRSGQLIGQALLHLVSRELEGALRGGLDSELDGRLHALARGLGALAQQLPEAELPQLLAGLAHSEASLLLQEAAQKPPFESSHRQRLGAGSDHTEASLMSRLHALNDAFDGYRHNTLDPAEAAEG